MKVIFLDIDGVLDSYRSCLAYGNYPHSNTVYELFDDVAVSLLRNFCKDNDIKLVLSSCWRRFDGWEALEFTLDLPIIDKTPSKLSAIRGEEIAEWLREHPEVKEYAILDDSEDMLEEQKERFVQTSEYNGFSYEDYVKLENIFKVKK